MTNISRSVEGRRLSRRVARNSFFKKTRLVFWGVVSGFCYFLWFWGFGFSGLLGFLG